MPKTAKKKQTGRAKPSEQMEQQRTRPGPSTARPPRGLIDEAYYQLIYDKSKTGEAIRAFCREANTTLDTYTRLAGASRRAVASWLAGDAPSRASQRTLSEMSRLFVALAEVMPASQIGQWLDNPSPTFEGSTPLQVIERGESDRVWRLIWEIQTGRAEG